MLFTHLILRSTQGARIAIKGGASMKDVKVVKNKKTNNQEFVERMRELTKQRFKEMRDAMGEYAESTPVDFSDEGIDEIFDIWKEWAEAQDRYENKWMIVDQIMVGSLEKVRRQIKVMDAKLDLLLEINDVSLNNDEE